MFLIRVRAFLQNMKSIVVQQLDLKKKKKAPALENKINENKNTFPTIFKSSGSADTDAES